jgi:prepilin-type processing-associated H-X9-DG protein
MTKLTGHVAHMREKKNAWSILVEKPEEKRQLQVLFVDGSVILKRTLK